LRGRPYAVNFLFTSCPTSCPPLAEASQALQKRVKRWSEGPEHAAQIVSITVDPLTDTPEKLKAFGQKYGSDPGVWRFARTDDYEKMEKLVTEGFMLPVLRKDASRAKTVAERKKILATDPTPLDTAHSLRFVLVDGEGKIRGLFNKSDEDLDKLDAALRHLAGR
jgi:protein SCO1/2